MKNVGVLGSGIVGQVLADGFINHGYQVMRGSRDPSKLSGWKESAGPKAQVGSFADTARFGELLVLAVKGTAAEAALDQCGEAALAGKIIIDATNPIADAPPMNGVLRFFTGPNDSLMERLQRRFSGAHLVKAFSCVGNALFVNPKLPGGPPTMFICGNDASAKKQVEEVLQRFGWEPMDMGTVEAARAIEPLCMLWCIPGMLHNHWTHAFKLLNPS